MLSHRFIYYFRWSSWRECAANAKNQNQNQKKNILHLELNKVSNLDSSSCKDKYSYIYMYRIDLISYDTRCVRTLCGKDLLITHARVHHCRRRRRLGLCVSLCFCSQTSDEMRCQQLLRTKVRQFTAAASRFMMVCLLIVVVVVVAVVGRRHRWRSVSRFIFSSTTFTFIVLVHACAISHTM